MYLLRKTITDDYVSFETARLLKEAGFDWPCEKWFELKGCTPVEWGADARCNWNVSEDDFSRPTLSLAAKWLRETWDLHIEISYDKKECMWTHWICMTVHTSPDVFFPKAYCFCSYKEALEQGIKDALMSVIELCKVKFYARREHLKSEVGKIKY